MGKKISEYKGIFDPNEDASFRKQLKNMSDAEISRYLGEASSKNADEFLNGIKEGFKKNAGLDLTSHQIELVSSLAPDVQKLMQAAMAPSLKKDLKENTPLGAHWQKFMDDVLPVMTEYAKAKQAHDTAAVDIALAKLGAWEQNDLGGTNVNVRKALLGLADKFGGVAEQLTKEMQTSSSQGNANDPKSPSKDGNPSENPSQNPLEQFFKWIGDMFQNLMKSFGDLGKYLFQGNQEQTQNPAPKGNEAAAGAGNNPLSSVVGDQKFPALFAGNANDRGDHGLPTGGFKPPGELAVT